MGTTAAAVSADTFYEQYVNPLLNLLRMNVRYERCAGAELQAAGGKRNAVELAHSPGVFWSEVLRLARRAILS